MSIFSTLPTKAMGDFGGPQPFQSSAQHGSADLSFHSHHFSALDFFQKQNSFGFSPGTSPAPNDIKHERTASFYELQNRTGAVGQSSFLAPTEFQYHSSMKNNFYDPVFPVSSETVQQPSRLRIPSTTTKQKHGQLTPPPSESSPTNDSPTGETSQESGRFAADTAAGPSTRKRRSTQSNQVPAATPQPMTAPRRRKKTSRSKPSAVPA